VILVHYRNGTTHKLDPKIESELRFLDSPDIQKLISRVAIIDNNGHRVDLPQLKSKVSRIWIERVTKGDSVRGERVCIRSGSNVLRVTLYYSDGRVVVDL
jgi:hypothetical protein